MLEPAYRSLTKIPKMANTDFMVNSVFLCFGCNRVLVVAAMGSYVDLSDYRLGDEHKSLTCCMLTRCNKCMNEPSNARRGPHGNVKPSVLRQVFTDEIATIKTYMGRNIVWYATKSRLLSMDAIIDAGATEMVDEGIFPFVNLDAAMDATPVERRITSLSKDGITDPETNFFEK